MNVSRIRRPLLLAALISTLLTTGCAYHEGDQTARDWQGWVKQHPLAGARVTDISGANISPFRGEFEAYARLTVAANPASLSKAMASMCAFDKATHTPTKYFLQIERILVQAPCDADPRTRVIAFWSTTTTLTGIEQLTFTSHGIDLHATDAALTALVPQVEKAATTSGYAATNATNHYASPHAVITQRTGVNLTKELGLTQATFDTVGDKVRKIEVVPGRVSAATSGTIAQARAWQATAAQGSGLLTVTPTHLVTSAPLTATERDLAERLSVDPAVTDVAVRTSDWTIDAPSTTAARSVVAALGREPAITELGQLTLDVAVKGRDCQVRPVFPEKGRADALLDLCDRTDVADVDDRAPTMDLRLTENTVPAVFKILHRVPAGQDVYLELADNSTIDITTGPALKVQFPDSDLGKKLIRIWAQQK